MPESKRKTEGKGNIYNFSGNQKKFVFVKKPKVPITKGLFMGDFFFLHFFFFFTIKQLQKIK